MLTFGFVYSGLLGDNPNNAIMFAGVFLAQILRSNPSTEEMIRGEGISRSSEPQAAA